MGQDIIPYAQWWQSLPDHSMYGPNKSNTPPTDPRLTGGASGSGSSTSGDSGSVTGLLDQQLAEYGGLLQRQGQVQTDPRLLQAQMLALQQYGNLASNGGLDAQSQAMLKQALAQSNTAQQGQQGAIQQQAQRQGVAGSGFDLAQRLSAQQGGANAQAMASTQAAADARNRTLQALQQYGQLSGQISGQQFGQAQQNFGNAFDLANARNNVRTGQQNNVTNNQNYNRQLAGQAIQGATNATQGAFNFMNQQNQQGAGGQGSYGGGYQTNFPVYDPSGGVPYTYNP